MSVHTINKFSHLETVGDVVSQGALVCQDRLYLADMVLKREGSGVRCFVLKDKIPEFLAENPPSHKYATCEDYYYYARRNGLATNLSDVFPEHFFRADKHILMPNTRVLDSANIEIHGKLIIIHSSVELLEIKNI